MGKNADKRKKDENSNSASSSTEPAKPEKKSKKSKKVEKEDESKPGCSSLGNSNTNWNIFVMGLPI